MTLLPMLWNILFILLCVGECTNQDNTGDLSDEFHCKATPKQEVLKRIIKQLQLLATMEVTGNESQLLGTERVAVDGLCNQEQCDKLLELVKSFGLDGDGYDGNISPLTRHEILRGVTVGYVALLVYHGLLPTEQLQLLLDLGTRAINVVERYFNLPTELYLDFTHLVCRTEKEGARRHKRDLSHSVHADNCDMEKNGTCLKRNPDLINRDYSAILYLNEDFDGGEFFFADKRKKPQSFIKPRCGRLVGFSAGGENPHGVKSVRKGTRCAVGLWMTLDPSHEEEELQLATQLLNIMKTKGQRAVPQRLMARFSTYARANIENLKKKV